MRWLPTLLLIGLLAACQQQAQPSFSDTDWLDALVRSEPELARLELSADTPALRLRSGWRLLAEGQRRGDPGYFNFALRLAEPAGAKRYVSEAALLQGQALIQLHRFADAEQIARRLLARRPLADGYRLLGDALLEQGQNELAGKAYQQMLERRPSPIAYGRGAEFSYRSGELTRAIELIEMALEGAARSNDAATLSWTLRRAGHYLLARGDAAAAIGLLEDAERVAPNPNTSHLLALARLAGGHRQQAIDGLTQAVQDYPAPTAGLLLSQLQGDVAAVNTIGLIQRHGADIDGRGQARFLLSTDGDSRAVKHLLDAELAQRRDATTLTLAAWHALQTDQLAPAMRLIDEALAQQPIEPLPWLIGARIAHARGVDARARDYLARCDAHAALLFPADQHQLRELRAALAGAHEPIT